MKVLIMSFQKKKKTLYFLCYVFQDVSLTLKKCCVTEFIEQYLNIFPPDKLNYI